VFCGTLEEFVVQEKEWLLLALFEEFAVGKRVATSLSFCVD
jgi:hypothetical protein